MNKNFKMTHLLINPHEDSKYPITWVLENCKTCKLDKKYIDRYEPVLPIAIWVRLPNSDGYHAYAANDEGWLSTCDSYNDSQIEDLKDISTIDGILAVEKNVNDWVNDHYKNKDL